MLRSPNRGREKIAINNHDTDSGRGTLASINTELHTKDNLLVGADLCVRPEERGHTQVPPYDTVTY
jgi:hypothetical protein